MFSVCFALAAEYSVADWFLQACLQVLTDDGCLCANESALVPLSCKVRQTSLHVASYNSSETMQWIWWLLFGFLTIWRD